MARRRINIDNLLRTLQQQYGASTAPALPNFEGLNILEWIETARPTVGRIHRNWNLIPFWLDIYLDDHPEIMVIAGRQTYKTTACSDIVAHTATTIERCEVAYVTDSSDHLNAFSKQRLRYETFKQNPLLASFLRYGRANVGEISLNNDTAIYCMDDANDYRKVEGKSLELLVTDETQYHDSLQNLSKAEYSQFQTKGRQYLFGIGGEEGSEYYRKWKESDQRVWRYDDKYWRDKLKFNEKGQIINDDDDLKKILSGRWVPLNPQGATIRHGYWIPQTIVPSIPATIHDAIYKYKTKPKFSIEYSEKKNPPNIHLSHSLGQFYKAERRPITPEMVLACMEPYRYLDYLRAEEVRALKAVFGQELRVLGGVDFGSSPTKSATVPSVLLHWRKSGRYQLAWIEKRPQEHGLDQSRYIAELFGPGGYNCDLSVGDLGYGQDRVKMIQDGGRDSHDVKFDGLTSRKFRGCRSIGDETKPQMEYKIEIDEHGTELGRIQIDKTTSIEKFVNFVGWHVTHPTAPWRTDEKLTKKKREEEENYWTRPKLMIPYSESAQLQVDYLIDEFCSITRKDLDKDPDSSKEDARQKAKKEYNHPSDVVMSLIYDLAADENYDDDAFKILSVKKRR